MRPEGPAPAISARPAATCAVSRSSSSVTSDLDREQRELLRQPRLVHRCGHDQHRLEPAPEQRAGAAGPGLGGDPRRRRQRLDPVELRREHAGERRAFGGPRLGQRREQRLDLGDECGQQRLGLLRRRAFAVEHAAHPDQVRRGHRREVEPEPRCRLRRRERRHDRALQRLGVQPRHPAPAAARQPQHHRHRPAREQPARGSAYRRVERLHPVGQPQPQVEAAAIDAPRLPGPGESIASPDPVGEAGHRAQRHSGPLAL